MNWSHNQLAAVDVETTGTDPEVHEIWQIAVVPLNAEFEPIEDVSPFYTTMKPTKPSIIDRGALKLSDGKLAGALINGLDWERVADLFGEWFQGLGLGLNKRLLPLAHNWQFDRAFLVRWLGQEHFETFFSGHARDTMHIASFLKDYSDFRNRSAPFDKLGLGHLAKKFGIPHDNPHDALADCLVTAQLYKRFIGDTKLFV